MVKGVIRMALFKFYIIRKENHMNLAWAIVVMVAAIMHTVGTMISDEQTGKILRNAAFGFYGTILILMMGGVIK